MKYDRLTRKVKIEVGETEYALVLTMGMLEELEDVLPNGKTLVGTFLDRETPRIKLIRKAFCLGMFKGGEQLSEDKALKVFDKFCEEHGMQEAISVYYVLMAASNILGTAISNTILEGAGMIVKDTEVEETPKNA